MIDQKQLRGVIKYCLDGIGLYSKEAENLLMGTAAQESRLGTYLRQLGGGPALGIMQMEPATFNDIKINYLSYRSQLVSKILGISGCLRLVPEYMEWNIALSICMARIHYYRIPEPLPIDIISMAHYWKKYYNTYLGSGTEKEFIDNYNTYCL
jgi:hypothetical protein